MKKRGACDTECEQSNGVSQRLWGCFISSEQLGGTYLQFSIVD